MTDRIKVNERGIRIGESHPNARLTDLEVEQLIADRGPESDPRMSLRELAVKWGLSKSGVKAILDGRCRAQAPAAERLVAKSTGMQAAAATKVRVRLNLTLAERARLRRLGGSVWVQRMLRKVRT